MKIVENKSIHRLPQIAEPRPTERNLWYSIKFKAHTGDYRHRIGDIRLMIRQAVFESVQGGEW